MKTKNNLAIPEEKSGNFNIDTIGVKVSKTQVIAENKYLEKLVEEGTIQLLASNKELKKEIAQHKKTLQVLQKAEENYREIFDKASEAIFVNELETWKIIDVNKKACKITGYSKKDFINGHPADFTSSSEHYSQKKANAKLRAVVTEGDQNFEWQFRYKDGSIHWIEVSLTIAYIAGIKRILSSFHEIDNRKAAEHKLEEEIKEKQMQITEAVITAEENGRQEIGQELHDNIQQILLTSRLYLDLAKKKEVTPPHPHIDEVHGMISKAITEIRSLSHAMISPFLNNQGLFDALDHLVNTTSKISGLAIDVTTGNIDESSIPDKVRLAIYRIVQEQFTNIIKHAKAQKVDLKLLDDGGGAVKLSIHDDGVGFDPSKKTKGFGLINLRTRASLCNGEMQIISSVGKGCKLIIIFNCDL